MDFLKRTWAEIRLDALAHNFRQIRRKVGPDCKIMAVVKADGYGHGDRQVAQVFQREGANWFAVSNIEEAMHLRQGGITKPVLIWVLPRRIGQHSFVPTESARRYFRWITPRRFLNRPKRQAWRWIVISNWIRE